MKNKRKYIFNKNGHYVKEKRIVTFTMWTIALIGIILGMLYLTMINVNLPTLNNNTFQIKTLQ